MPFSSLYTLAKFQLWNFQPWIWRCSSVHITNRFSLGCLCSALIAISLASPQSARGQSDKNSEPKPEETEKPKKHPKQSDPDKAAAKAEAKAEEEQEKQEKAAQKQIEKEQKTGKRAGGETEQNVAPSGEEPPAVASGAPAEVHTDLPAATGRPVPEAATGHPVPENVRQAQEQIEKEKQILQKSDASMQRQLRAAQEQAAFLQLRVDEDDATISKLKGGPDVTSKDPLQSLIHAKLASNDYAGAIYAMDTLKEKEFENFRTASIARNAPPISAQVIRNAEQLASRDQQAALDPGSELERLIKIQSRSSEQQAQYNSLAQSIRQSNETAVTALRVDAPDDSDTVSALQSALSSMEAGTVGVYVILGHDQLEFIVVAPAPAGYKYFAEPITDSRLSDQIAQMIQAVHSPRKDPKPAASNLYNTLMGPIDDYLRQSQTKMILWSLEGPLRYVPLNALYDQSRGHYLVEEYENVLITPASIVYLTQAPSPSDDWTALAMGMSEPTAHTEPLPNVPIELRSVVHDASDPDSHGPLNGVLKMDSDFSVEELETGLASHPQVVHLATHFILDPDSGGSYLLFGAPSAGGAPEQLDLESMESDPRLNLAGTELLTLSACDTASRGRMGNGSEVDGLAMTAHRQHAKSVIATLWPVNDASTAMLMADFYARWMGSPSVSKAEALRQAQLSLLYGPADNTGAADTSDRGVVVLYQTPVATGFQHPYYWAPFILLGNPE
jgi:CHAT domain-containing protein